MTMGERITVNAGRIVHETVDGEVIVIDLETGTYFSLTKSAALLWPSITEGVTRSRLAAELAAAFEGPASELEAGLDAFLEQLKAEEIVLAEPVSDDGDAGAPAAGDRAPFEPPMLAKYTNMSDLLLLDPIHDVDEAGWPNQKPD